MLNLLGDLLKHSYNLLNSRLLLSYLGADSFNQVDDPA